MSKEEILLHQILSRPIPEHIAIIMDGNGRWAKKRGMPRIYGHRAGTESVRVAVKACGELKVKVLTLYTFSTENWTRPKTEVNGLFSLLCKMLRKEVEELDRNGVCLETIGRTEALNPHVIEELNRAKSRLEANRGKGLLLNLALNYGGRQEIMDAVNKILKSGLKSVDESKYKDYLYTKGLPDPDLVIRTSGEERLSNFLIYQAAYAEFYVTSVLWPDFRRADLYEAIAEFQSRDRRFGSA